MKYSKNFEKLLAEIDQTNDHDFNKEAFDNVLIELWEHIERDLSKRSSDVNDLNNDTFDAELYELCENIERDLYKRSSDDDAPPAKRVKLSEMAPSPALHNQQGGATSNDIAETSLSRQIANESGTSNDDNKYCDICDTWVKRRYFTSHLNSNKHKNMAAVYLNPNVTIIESAFKHRIVTYRISDNSENNFSNVLVENFFINIRDDFLQLIQEALVRHRSLKVNFILSGDFTHQIKQVTESFDFQSANSVICLSDDLDVLLKEITALFTSKLEDFEKKDSGWSLVKILHLDVNLNKYSPLRGSSYIELPLDIKRKQAVINVKNHDNECFKWAILSALHPATTHSDRVKSYERYSNTLDMSGIEYPVQLKDIPKFERNNDISINVFSLDYNKDTRKHVVVGPIFHTKQRKTRHINLLYLSNETTGHYCYIKNLSRLVNSQFNNYFCKKYICDGCLINFTSAEKLSIHQERDCVHLRVEMPSSSIKRLDQLGNEIPENILKFRNYNHKMEVPFVVYADYEALLVPISDDQRGTNTINVQRHDVFSFGYYTKCSFDDSLSKYRTYRGSDCGKVFVETLSCNIPMSDLTTDEHHRFVTAVNCHICDTPLNGDSVRDHDHLTGTFRGAAHSNCNLNYKVPKFIPIFLHNLTNYDADFIVHELGFTDGNIDIIPLNKEKYISITKQLRIGKDVVNLRFLDSFKFMSASLDSLVRNLNKSSLLELRKQYPDQEDFQLLTRKGVYPYKYITSIDELESTTAPPSSEHFYNKLTDSSIDDDDYNHAQKVWTHFKCRNMGEYSDLYLKTDVLLLADVFENFRKVCLKTYQLDPAHYFTLPGLSWDAMLKLTGIHLELLTDFDMLSYFKKGIRGGISQCSNRHAKANNKYMPTFDENEDSSYLIYLDANNLYGYFV